MTDSNATRTPIPASQKADAIETVISGFLTYPGNSAQDRQGRFVWLSVLQDGAANWKFEDWLALEADVKKRLSNHPSYSFIQGVIGSKLIIAVANEETAEA